MFWLLILTMAIVPETLPTKELDPLPKLRCIGVYSVQDEDLDHQRPMAGIFYGTANKDRNADARSRDIARRTKGVLLDHRVPLDKFGLEWPDDQWYLVEVNQSPDPEDSYIVLYNRIRRRFVVRWLEADPEAIFRTPRPTTRPLRPSTRPVPPWPGIGCLNVYHDDATKLWQAWLVGPEYYAEDELGRYTEGQRIRKPFEQWRVVKIVGAPSPYHEYVLIRSDQTGQTLKLRIWLGGVLPRDWVPSIMPMTRPAMKP